MSGWRAPLQPVAARLLGTVRRGPRTVLWTPPMRMGIGNILYLWFWAHREQQAGRPAAVLLQDQMRPWLPHFPGAERLTVERSEVRLSDRRVLRDYQGFGSDFTPTHLHDFSHDVILRAPSFARALAQPSSPDQVVVNVRRGEYYSEPAVRGNYSFDICAYLEVALELAVARGPISSLHVVSDGLDWCRARLGWLERYAPLTFGEPSRPPIDQLAAVSTAKRLILANSTFSYWAGYVSTVLSGEPAEVIAPAFHARHLLDGHAYQLDPRWTIVRDIPGGWDS